MKVYLFVAFVGSVSLDWYGKYSFDTKNIELMSGSDGLFIPIIITIVLILFVFLDYHHIRKNQKLKEKVFDILQNPTISLKIKRELIDKFLND